MKKPTIRRQLRTDFAELMRAMRHPPLLLWALFLISFPFYVIPSGLPQPADWLIIALIPTLVTHWKGKLLDVGRPFRVLIAFTIYAAVINLMWTFALATFSINLKHGFLLSPTFYIYNALMLFTVLMLYQRYGLRFLWVTTRAVLLSVAVQVAMSFVVHGYVTRASLMFNNPNQLGYYALLCACILLLGMKHVKLSTTQVTFGLVSCCYLALMSASKAALGSIALLGIALMVTRVRTMVLACLVLAVLAFTSNPFSRAIEKAEARIQNDQSYGLLEERGYDRVWNNPEYWFFGAGEGDYKRFADTTVIHSHELHSSGATLFFSYGVIGVVMFAVFLWLALRGVSARMMMIVVPGFAFGMVHQGLRFTFMWVMLGVVMALRHYEQQQRREARRAAAVTSRPVPAGN